MHPPLRIGASHFGIEATDDMAHEKWLELVAQPRKHLLTADVFDDARICGIRQAREWRVRHDVDANADRDVEDGGSIAHGYVRTSWR